MFPPDLFKLIFFTRNAIHYFDMFYGKYPWLHLHTKEWVLTLFIKKTVFRNVRDLFNVIAWESTPKRSFFWDVKSWTNNNNNNDDDYNTSNEKNICLTILESPFYKFSCRQIRNILVMCSKPECLHKQEHRKISHKEKFTGYFQGRLIGLISVWLVSHW